MFNIWMLCLNAHMVKGRNVHTCRNSELAYTELRKTAGEQTFLINGISNHFIISEICIWSIEIHCMLYVQPL